MTSVDTHEQGSGIALHTPQSIAAALPHLLGFHPDESLICLWLRDRGVLVVQRADLPCVDPDGSDGAVLVDAFLEAYLQAAAHIEADEVLIVCATRKPAPGRTLVSRLADRVGVRVRVALVITGGMVHEVDNPGRWHWISTDDRQDASRWFEGAHTGIVPARSREDVICEVEFDECAHWPLRADDAEPADLDEVIAVLTSGNWSTPTARRTIRDAGLTVEGRDLIMWWCARSAIGRRRALMEALLAGLRATRHGPNLACAAAASAWLCGDGVRTNGALDRCLREDPHHVMGRMLRAAMTTAVPPAAFARMLQDVDPGVVGVDPGVVDEVSVPGYSRP